MARFEKRGKVFEITSNDPRYAVELREHLRGGWTRVYDPRCEEPFGAEPVNPVLEDALRADPDDAGAALVYADWLQQQGHPRGALIAVQHRLSLNPSDAGLAEAEQRILDDAGDALLSKPLLAHLALYRGASEIAPSRNLYAGGRVTFDHGFIREARVVLHQRGADEDLLWELLRHPSARVLARLNVRVQRPRDIALVTALLAHGPRPPLRTLALQTLDTSLTVDLSGIDEAFPLLSDLEVTIDRVRFGDLRLPALQRLVVRATQHDLGRILAQTAWPALDELVLGGEPELLAMAFERPVFPVLRSLQLGPCERALFVCRMLVRSPSASTLEALHLVDTRLDPESVTMLVENRAKFPRLRIFDVGTQRSDLRDRLGDAGYPL